MTWNLISLWCFKNISKQDLPRNFSKLTNEPWTAKKTLFKEFCQVAFQKQHKNKFSPITTSLFLIFWKVTKNILIEFTENVVGFCWYRTSQSNRVERTWFKCSQAIASRLIAVEPRGFWVDGNLVGIVSKPLVDRVLLAVDPISEIFN